MSPYIVTRERLAAMLGDPRLYAIVPELAVLQPLYAECYQASREAGCCGKDIIPMFPVMREALQIVTANRKTEGFADRLRNILTLRTGRTVQAFVIHYRESVQGKPQRIAFR